MNLTKNAKPGWLYEISVIRPFLLILLVSYHAFCPFSASWQMPVGIEANEIYKWIAYLSQAFRLEAFVFVSGYVFQMQLKKRKFEDLKSLTISKFKRLIIPCWIFGVLYFLLLRPTDSFLPVITGIGHLWYLPTLFYCFIASYWLFDKKLSQTKLLIAAFCLIAPSILPIPLQINRACYYLFFFLLGGAFYEWAYVIKEKSTKRKSIILWIIFSVLFIAVNLLREYNIAVLQNTPPLFYKAILIAINAYAKAVLAVVGIATIYVTASLYVGKHTVSKWMLDVGSLGYGVYIFHQFILRILYYQTDVPEIVGTIWLPWLGTMIALILSILLTLLVRKTSVGRKLM